jgi:hypothetical protein
MKRNLEENLLIRIGAGEIGFKLEKGFVCPENINWIKFVDSSNIAEGLWKLGCIHTLQNTERST